MEDRVSWVQRVTGLRGFGLRVFGVRPEITLTRRKSASGSPLTALGSAGFRLWPPVMEDRTSISHPRFLYLSLDISLSLDLTPWSHLSLSIPQISPSISGSHSLCLTVFVREERKKIRKRRNKIRTKRNRNRVWEFLKERCRFYNIIRILFFF
jgi:hypothetical protein